MKNSLIKNTFPELVDAIKTQNGFLGVDCEDELNTPIINTIMPDRIMVIYKDYIAVNNFDKYYSFSNAVLSPQTDILLFKVYKIENPGNVFAKYIPYYSYNFCDYIKLIQSLQSKNLSDPNVINSFGNSLDFLEITLLVQKILESYNQQYASSSDLFSTKHLAQYLPPEKISEIQNSNTQLLLSHPKPFDDVPTNVNNKAKIVIAEFVKKENINPNTINNRSILPPNISLVRE